VCSARSCASAVSRRCMRARAGRTGAATAAAARVSTRGSERRCAVGAAGKARPAKGNPRSAQRLKGATQRPGRAEQRGRAGRGQRRRGHSAAPCSHSARTRCPRRRTLCVFHNRVTCSTPRVWTALLFTHWRHAPAFEIEKRCTDTGQKAQSAGETGLVVRVGARVARACVGVRPAYAGLA